MKLTQAAFAALAIGMTGLMTAAPVIAQSGIAQQGAFATSGDFIKKSKTLKGSWSVVTRGDKTFIVFAENFRAAKGPDLKIFLSPNTVSDATGENAVDGALSLGELKTTRGTQEYEVPAGVDLSQYGSVLVHCEAYSVLWGGGNL